MNRSYTWNRLLLLLPAIILFSCKSPSIITSKSEVFLTPLRDSGMVMDSQLTKLIEPYRDSLDKIMNEVIGTAAITMDKGKPESLLGNFVSDLCLKTINEHLGKAGQPHACFIVLNTGGLRAVISEGPVTRGEIFELMPFENELVVVKIPYDSLASMIRYIGDKGGIPLSGMRMQLSDKSLKSLALDDGTEVSAGHDYYVATSDFLALGGDGMTMLKTPKGYYRTGIKVRDAIIDYIQKQSSEGRKLDAVLDGRIK